VTEKEAQSVFMERYSGGNIDEALMASLEEIILTLLKEHAESGETLPYIFRTIAQGKSRIFLFVDMFSSGRANPLVLMNYLPHFNYINRAMLDVVNYMYENYETIQPWFKERFSREGLKERVVQMTIVIEKQVGMPRSINFDELNHDELFFNTALAGILGIERFNNYTEECAKCLKVLRQCQAACYALEAMPVYTQGS